MWKLICSLIMILSLSSCQNDIEIFPADDLNLFLSDNGTQTFFVKTKLIQRTHCQEIEKWAKSHLTGKTDKYHTYDFIQYDDELTLQGNPWLKKDASAIVGSYLMCSMDSHKKHCYICHEK